MSVNKLVTKVDGVINKTIDFNDLKAGLSAGAHTITVEAFNGAALVSTQTKNITVAAVVSYDADYQAVLDYATAQSIALPTSTQQDIDNQLLIDYKATGAWAKDDVFLKFKGTASAAFKLICWKRLVKAVGYGGLTWSDSGVVGNGTNGYIDSLFNPTTNGVNYTLNNAGLVYVSTLSVNEIKAVFGSYEGSNDTYILFKFSSSTESYMYLHNGGNIVTGIPGELGVNALYRLSNSQLKGISGDGTIKSPTYTAVGLPNQNIYILGRNNSGTTDLLSTERISYATLGSSKDAEHAAMKTVLE